MDHLSDDVAIQGSRAKGTEKATSDIDIALKVDESIFNKMIKKYFGAFNAGSTKERTM